MRYFFVIEYVIETQSSKYELNRLHWAQLYTLFILLRKVSNTERKFYVSNKRREKAEVTETL